MNSKQGGRCRRARGVPNATGRPKEPNLEFPEPQSARFHPHGFPGEIQTQKATESPRVPPPSSRAYSTDNVSTALPPLSGRNSLLSPGPPAALAAADNLFAAAGVQLGRIESLVAGGS